MYFEQGLLENITSLRTQWLNTMADRSVNEQVNFSTEFMVQMGAFMSVVESYPAIQSTDTIRDIIVSLEGTQNRIAAARIFYNDAVNDYNTAILSFPNNMIAGTFGFEGLLAPGDSEQVCDPPSGWWWDLRSWRSSLVAP